jgi:hypothetical protein
MKGIHINTLNVLTKNQTSEVIVWTKKGNQGSKWFTGRINLEASNGDYTVIFEGIRGTGSLVGFRKVF